MPSRSADTVPADVGGAGEVLALPPFTAVAPGEGGEDERATQPAASLQSAMHAERRVQPLASPRETEARREAMLEPAEPEDPHEASLGI
jgi:hypothetical protein